VGDPVDAKANDLVGGSGLIAEDLDFTHGILGGSGHFCPPAMSSVVSAIRR
jgi:hypothetical protein